MGDGFILQGEGINFWQLSRVGNALALEINTGLKHSQGSVMNLAKRYCGSLKRTKRGVLADYVAWIKESMPDYEPNASVSKALTK